MSVDQAYERFINSLVPTQRERDAAVSHRASVESALRNNFSVSEIRETGSFSHGTGVRSYSDVDVMMRLYGARPDYPDALLVRLKAVLDIRFPFTAVKVRRPAVVIEFASKAEQWEIIPGYRSRTSTSGYDVVNIPGAPSGWIETAPRAHLDYVNTSNNIDGVRGGAKKLARMLKSWKYYNSVPVSSFYLEMRAAEHVRTQSSFIPVWDMCQVLTKLNQHQLAAMNDPMHIASRIQPCSSSARRSDALSRLSTATTRATKALDAYKSGDSATAFYYLDHLYNGWFPSRYAI